jgi:hypothetical protein
MAAAERVKRGRLGGGPGWTGAGLWWTGSGRRPSIPSPLMRRHRHCAALTVGRRHPGRNIGHLLLACAVLCRFEGGSSEGGGGGGVWKAGGEAEANGHRLPTKLATMGMGNSNAPGDHGQRDPDHKADMRFVRAGLETHQVFRSCEKM